jgi:DNA-binding NarL/FixJ family response regulator
MTIKVLIVDDHAMVREGLRVVLQSQPDIEVAGEAADGAQAIARAQALHPDVILMDLIMPDMNGVEALERLRQLKIESRVLVLTSSLQDEWIQRALKAGAHGYVLKASKTSDLINAIQRVARGQRALDPDVAQAVVEHIADHQTLDSLTAREREVFDLLARGRNPTEIAEALTVSEATVRTHTASILDKLALRDRVQLMAYALKRGLVQPEDLA